VGITTAASERLRGWGEPLGVRQPLLRDAEIGTSPGRQGNQDARGHDKRDRESLDGQGWKLLTRSQNLSTHIM
jgi:hypothetical protein